MIEQPTTERRYYLRRNNQEESWDLCQRGAINDDGEPLNALIARFFDGSIRRSPLGEALLTLLNAGILTPRE